MNSPNSRVYKIANERITIVWFKRHSNINKHKVNVSSLLVGSDIAATEIHHLCKCLTITIHEIQSGDRRKDSGV